MALPLIGGLVGKTILGASIAALLRGAVSWSLRWIGPILLNALLFFGFSFVSTQYAVGPLISEMSARLAGAPSVFVDVLGYVGADVAISMILSAYVVRAASKLVLRRV